MPPPVPAGVRVLARQRAGQFDPASTVPDIGLVLLSHALDVGAQHGLDRGRQHRHPILVPLAVAYQDLVRPWHPIKSLEDGANLVARQHDGQVLGPLGSDDVVEPWQL